MNILMSYAFSQQNGWPWCLRQIKENGCKTLVDSGAFTAHQIGIKVTLDGYANFLKKNIGAVDEYIALDVLGDKEATLKTYKKMIACKLRPMGVMTTDMSPDEALQYLDHNPRVCAAGGSWGAGAVSWYPHKLELLYRKSGGRAKIHALGFTPTGYDGRTNIKSADSSSWTSAKRFGMVKWWNSKTMRTDGGRWSVMFGEDAPDSAQNIIRNSNMPSDLTLYDLHRGGNSFATNITAAAWVNRVAFVKTAHDVDMYLATVSPDDLSLVLQAMRHGNSFGGIDFEAIVKERKQVIKAVRQGTPFGRRYIQAAFDNYEKNIAKNYRKDAS